MTREEKGKSGQGERRVIAERLSGIDDWEMYRFLDQREFEPVCTVALRPQAGAPAVEYAVWREQKDGDEPGATGSVTRRSDASSWDDTTREDVLRQVAYRYEDDLGVTQAGLSFRFEGPPDDLDEDEDADEDDLENDEDEDADEDEDE